MSSKTSKDLLVFELFRNKDITYSTIDSLLKYGFDSNESLLCLDFEVDFPQMPDICLSQKCLLRQLLTDFRKNYNKSSDYWTQENDNNESEDSLRENKSFERNSNEVFIESESIVRQIKEKLLLQNQSLINPQNDNQFNKIFDICFDPIVDQLRESLIKVEKQKQEKDVILQKQRTELKVKEMSIQSLQNQIKALEEQLIREKMKVEKLEYKLKSNKSESIVKTEENHKINDNIKGLEELKAVYYNNDSECEQQSSGAEDLSPIVDRNSPKSNFVNYWTEVETNSPKTQDLNLLKTSLFTEFVSKHSTCSSESVENVICIDLDSNEESAPTPDFSRIKFNDKHNTSEELSESEGSPFSSSDVESIVCEPDIDCDDTSAVNSTFKPKVHLKVQNNRIVVNTSEQKPTLRTTTQIKPLIIQSKGQHNSQSNSSLRQYQCNYQNCTFSFVSSEGLKRHIRSVHTKEKPFKCHFEDCHKCFGRSDALKEHMKRHLGLKLFKCSYSECDFESVSSNSLKRHILSIHLKEKHFKCLHEKCDKTFGRKDSLKKHMEKQHQICDTY